MFLVMSHDCTNLWAGCGECRGFSVDSRQMNGQRALLHCALL